MFSSIILGIVINCRQHILIKVLGFRFRTQRKMCCFCNVLFFFFGEHWRPEGDAQKSLKSGLLKRYLEAFFEICFWVMAQKPNIFSPFSENGFKYFCSPIFTLNRTYAKSLNFVVYFIRKFSHKCRYYEITGSDGWLMGLWGKSLFRSVA